MSITSTVSILQAAEKKKHNKRQRIQVEDPNEYFASSTSSNKEDILEVLGENLTPTKDYQQNNKTTRLQTKPQPKKNTNPTGPPPKKELLPILATSPRQPHGALPLLRQPLRVPRRGILPDAWSRRVVDSSFGVVRTVSWGFRKRLLVVFFFF